MPRGGWHGGPWPGKDRWWGHPGAPGGPGAAWRQFGRRMLFGLLFFLTFMALLIAAVVWVVIWLVDGVSSVPLVVLVPLGLFMLAVVAGRRFARTWRPVRGLIRAAGALADGDYSARVAPGGSPAVRQVVDSFNDMARRLETADEQRRRLLADVGHELRTPLTVIRGEIEAIIDGVHEADPEHLELLVGEVEVMERLLEDLRTLSLLDAGALALHTEPTDITALVEDVADTHRRRAAEAGVTVAVRVADVGEVDVDPVRIREVLANLVMNALRAMPEGGTLSLETTGAGGSVVIRVGDTGVGIAADELSRVFDRFHKGTGSRGSGLGLTISRDLVAAHGGQLIIESERGRGTVATIEVPAGR